MERIRAGKLDRLVLIQYAVETKSATGQMVQEWHLLARLMANKDVDRTKVDKEGYDHNKLTASLLNVFSIRYFFHKGGAYPNMPTPKMRLVENATGQIWEIKQVREVGRRAGWELECEYKH